MIQEFHFHIYTQRIENRDLKRYLHTCIHSNIIHNSQRLEATHVSFRG